MYASYVSQIMDADQYPGYGSIVGIQTGFLMSVFVTLACVLASADDFDAALERARDAGLNHRYNEVIEILTPFNAEDEPERRYITAAEIGRAFFHTGRYQEAHRAFRQAVRIHPERAETAIYLEATSYLLGDKEQAYAILREILKSGARDLYLAITLPGERRFAADPEVQVIIGEFNVPLDVDLERAQALGIRLGTGREAAIQRLGARSSSGTAPTLIARAGPALIWAFVFDAEQQLDEILLQAENLLRYTPYRLQFDNHLDWTATPAAAIAALGPPSQTSTSPDNGFVVSWTLPTFHLTLDFGHPRNPRPQAIQENTAMLRAVRLKRGPLESPDRMIE